MSHIRQISALVLGAASSVLFSSGCNVVIGLNKLSADNSPSEPQCTTNEACTEQATLAALDGPDASVGADGVVPAVCLQSTGRCVNLLSEDCKTITGEYKDNRAIVIGSLFATAGTTGTQNVPRQQSATLAVEEINLAGGIPSETAGVSRPLVMISCDVSSNLERAARHLAYDLKVPAIVGPNTSQDTLDVSNKVTIQAGVLAISPTAVAASIADLRDNDLTWLMIPSDDQRAPLMIRDINDLEASIKAKRAGSVKFSIIYRDDALGVGTRNSMSALVINDKPLADPVNAGSPGGNAHIVPYPAKDADYASILSKEIAFAPDIVVLAGTAETVTKILTPLEAGWTAATRPYYYFIDPSKGPELLAAVTGNEDLRVRIRGTGTRPTTSAEAVADAFKLAYQGRYGTAPTASGAGACYDATYSIAYALATIQDEPITSAAVARGLRKLSGGSVDVTTGSLHLLEAFQTLASGQSINALGTNCPLEWDSRGIVAGGTIDMWCIGNTGGTPAFQSSGLTFDIKTQTYNGVYTQCGP